MHVFMCAFVYLGDLGWEQGAKEIIKKPRLSLATLGDIRHMKERIM